MAKNIEINIKGSDGNYEVLYPKTNSSTSVVSEEVITNLGLTSGSSGNDVLKWFSQYNLYWWRRRAKTFTEKRTNIIGTIQVTRDANPGYHFYYSKTISIDSNGAISLVSPVTLDGIANSSTGATSLGNTLKPYLDDVPYYISSDIVDGKIYYVPLGSGIGYNSVNPGYITFGLYRYGSQTYYMVLSDQSLGDTKVPAQLVTSAIQVSDWEYIQSSNRNAYPDSGIQDGYEYNYLGVPYQQMSQTPNGILIGTFQINKTAFGGTKLFDSTEIEAGCGYYFTVDYDIEWTNNSDKTMQIGLMITSGSSGTIFDTSEGFCYNASYGSTITTGQDQGSSRIYYVNNARDTFLCLYTDTSAYDCNFLSTGIYFNFAGPNLTTSQLNNITISKANFTVKVYKQVLC